MSALEITRPMCASALARAWGKKPNTVTNWIINGARSGNVRRYLRAFKLGGQWMITPEAAEEFLASFAHSKPKKKTRDDEADTRRVLALLGAKCR